MPLLNEMELIGRLREIRKRKGMSVQDVANATGIPRAAIAKTEVGQRRLTVNDAVALCRALDVDLRVALSPEPMSVSWEVQV